VCEGAQCGFGDSRYDRGDAHRSIRDWGIGGANSSTDKRADKLVIVHDEQHSDDIGDSHINICGSYAECNTGK